MRADVQHAGVDVDDLFNIEHPLFEGGRRSHDFECGSRLVDVLRRPVATVRLRRKREVVRVERRLVRQRQNLSRQRVHHHDTAAGRVVFTDGGAQLALGDVLDVLVDCQFERHPGGRRPLDPAEGPIVGVGLHEQPSGQASDFLVVSRFETVQPLVVDAHVSEQMRGQFLVRIEAPVLLDETDALQIEFADALRGIEGNVALDVGEQPILPEPGPNPVPLRVIAIENLANPICRSRRIVDLRPGTATTVSASTL